MSTEKRTPPDSPRRGPEEKPAANGTDPSCCSMARKAIDCNTKTTEAPQKHTDASISPLAIYTLDDAADLLRVSPMTIRRLERSGALRRCPYTRNARYLGEELLRVARGGAR